MRYNLWKMRTNLTLENLKKLEISGFREYTEI